MDKVVLEENQGPHFPTNTREFGFTCSVGSRYVGEPHLITLLRWDLDWSGILQGLVIKNGQPKRTRVVIRLDYCITG